MRKRLPCCTCLFAGRQTWLSAFLLALATAACLHPNSPPPRGNTLRIGVAAPSAALPDIGWEGVSRNLFSDGFVGIAWNGRPTPQLASSWESLPDHAVRLTIRSGATFHDRTAITPHIARQSLEQVIRTYRQNWVSFESVTSVEESGQDLTIRLARPEPFLLADLANSNIEHPENRDIGHGAYRLISRDEKARVARLEAFDDYYRGRPSIDAIEIRGYQEQRSAWAALMRGEINAVHEINPAAVDFVEAATTVRTYPFVRPYYIFLGFNIRHPVLGRAIVRQALSQAVDRGQIIRIGLNGRGMPSGGPIWPYHWAYSTTQRTYSYNPEAAALRLDGAGLLLGGRAEPGRMPSRLRFTCLTIPDARYEKLALVLQKQLHDIGVDMQVEVMPLRPLLERLQSGRFDAFLLERSSGRSLAWTYTSFHSRYAFTGYRAADDALDRVRSAADDADTRVAVADLQRVFFEDPPAIFLAWPEVARGVSADFVVPYEAGRDVMGSLWQWRPAP